MKKIFTILLCATFFAMSAKDVSGAVVKKVPATTIECEKAPAGATNNGTDILSNAYGSGCYALHTDMVGYRHCVCGSDDAFYRNGYRAKLSKAVKEITVPPDSKNNALNNKCRRC